MLLIVLLICFAIGIGILAYLLAKCNSSHKNCDKEPFCGTCQGMSNKVCTDRKLLSKLYQSGELTENSSRTRKEGWPYITWDRFEPYGKRQHPCHN